MNSDVSVSRFVAGIVIGRSQVPADVRDRHSYRDATEDCRKTRAITAKCSKLFRDRSVEYGTLRLSCTGDQ
jgi:hypothetical protein